MKVIGLDDREYSWVLQPQNIDDANRSKLHLRARKILSDAFPFDVIHEEVTLPGSKFGKTNRLTADFFLPMRSIIVEVQGNQHTEYVKFMHKTKYDFYKALGRDKHKKLWCERNSICLIYFNDGETDEDWVKKLNER